MPEQQQKNAAVVHAQKNENRSCTFRRFCFGLTLLILIAAGGGVILWQLIPEHQRKAVATSIGGLEDGLFAKGNGTAPPPKYQFMQCTNSTSGSGRCCNGLPDICDMNISDIMYAGVHNGNAALQNGYRIAPNQIYSVESSLDYGYRAISMDIGKCDGVIKLVHGKCKLGTRDPYEVFNNINQWLDNNPTEILLFPIEINDKAGGEEVLHSEIYDVIASIDGFTDKMWSKGSLPYWPTLQELIDLNQRVLFLTYNGQKCSDPTVFCPPGFMDWFRYSKETAYHFETLDAINNSTVSCNATRGMTNGAFFGLNVFITLPNFEISSTVINTKSWLTNHIETCSQLNDNDDVNIVFVDFWDQGNLPEVVQNHNTQLAAAAAAAASESSSSESSSSSSSSTSNSDYSTSAITTSESGNNRRQLQRRLLR